MCQHNQKLKRAQCPCHSDNHLQDDATICDVTHIWMRNFFECIEILEMNVSFTLLKNKIEKN